MADVFLQSDQIIERGNAVQLAGVDEAHEQVADQGAVFGFEVEGVLSTKYGLFERPLDQRVIQRSIRLP